MGSMPHAPVTQKEGVSPYLALGFLLLVYCFNFIDRQIFAVLSPLIKADLGFNDLELGLLKGLAFALLYAIMGIPLAQLSDRTNRVRLVSICLALWSAMTAVSGLVSTFWQMAAARVGVGIGEAGGTPPSHSLIADYFPPEKRSFAFGIFSLGIPIGSVFGFLVGGALAEAIGWRGTFLTLGISGVVLSVAFSLVMREPTRGRFDDKSVDAGLEPTGLLTKLGNLWRIPLFRVLVVSGSFNAFTGYALNMWLMDMYVRSYGLTIWEGSMVLAALIGIGAGFGTVLGGQAADWAARKDPLGRLKVIYRSLIISVPLIFLGLSSDTLLLHILFLGVAFFFIYVSLGPTYSIIQSISPTRSRALSAAFYFLTQALVGAGLGPFVIGAVSEYLMPSFGDAEALRYALFITVPTSLLSGLVVWWAVARNLGERA